MHIPERFRKKRLLSVVCVVFALGLILGGTKLAIHLIRTNPDEQPHFAVSEEADNRTQQINYAGTGNAEDVEATTSNQYICVDYKGKLPSSPAVTSAATALRDIKGPIAELYQNGAFGAESPTDTDAYQSAATAAADAASQLSAATKNAENSIPLCYLVGLFKTGSSQMTTLAGRLDAGQATKADLEAAMRYADALKNAGISE